MLIGRNKCRYREESCGFVSPACVIYLGTYRLVEVRGKVEPPDHGREGPLLQGRGCGGRKQLSQQCGNIR